MKKMEKQEEIGIKNLDHLGIVAGLIDELEIEKIIDQKLGKDPREKISAMLALFPNNRDRMVDK